MTDRSGNTYDIQKFSYANTEQEIKDNINKIAEREGVVCTNNNSLYLKINGKLFKVQMEEVI